MSDESAGPAAAAAHAGAGDTLNSQIVDAVAAVNAILAGQAPADSMAMLGLVGAQTIGLGMHNAVARQQAEAAINASATAALCARMIGTGVPLAAQAGPAQALIAMAEAQAQAAVLLLKAQAQPNAPDAAAAVDALARIAAAATARNADTPPPQPSRATRKTSEKDEEQA
ncbi:RebB family R body protein [Sphingomonas sp. DT-207]|uniref:RebB family R body protein n=1 Tax=Sphingomonas sp. DT-207 TaxID=3396167 RepID=UPI003F1E1FEF